VTLTATPAAGSTFAGWSGACAGTGLCNLTMSADQTVTATFAVSGTEAPPPKCVVPNLKGKTLKKAEKALKAADCKLGKVKPKGQKTGKVKKQGPKPGTELSSGGKVNVKLS
jgi:beta-lactam-binding protein with PASTA domain